MASLWKFTERNMKQTEQKKKKGIWMTSSLQVLTNVESRENKAVSVVLGAYLVRN